jgi:hypothetical protein
MPETIDRFKLPLNEIIYKAVKASWFVLLFFDLNSEL